MFLPTCGRFLPEVAGSLSLMKTHTIVSLTLDLFMPMNAIAGYGHENACKGSREDCVNKVVTKLKLKGFIGVELDHNKETNALTVTRVVADTPAEQAGIMKGDELFAVNGLTYEKENMDVISKVMKPDNQVTVTIKRGGITKDLQVTLAPMPKDLIAKYVGKHVLSYLKHAKKAKHATR